MSTEKTDPKVNSDATNSVDIKKIKVPSNITFNGVGINLIPTLSAKEVEVVEKKSTFNLGAAVLFMFVAIFAISVFGFNLLTKLSLNNNKEELSELEASVRAKSSIIRDNNKIVDRVDIYRQVQEQTYSPGAVMKYWEETSKGFVTITSITVTNGLEFRISGQSTDPNNVAKMWHLLSVDEKVENVNLRSISRSLDTINFQFEGDFNVDFFEAQGGSNSESEVPTGF